MKTPIPYYAVWEITLACNLACRHCGSRAGKKRASELTTDEALRVVDQLAEIGVSEVSLIGGEAYLRPDWDVILKALSDHGIKTSIVTGGRGLTRERIKRAKEAGVLSVGVSVDGLEEAHDWLRGWPGSFRAAMQALDILREEGIMTSANTQVNRLNFADLDQLLTILIEKGIAGWQVQLTAALGRAADWEMILFQPYDIPPFMDKLAKLKERCNDAGIDLGPGNDIGYFGPYESFIRSRGPMELHWKGCTAGCAAIGIESDGTFKGCPSLQTDAYTAGSLKEQSAREIWQNSPTLKAHREWSKDDLWGFCGSCYYAEVCKGGCTFTAHALLGKPGNMPYCHFRALELEKKGLREVLVKVKEAPGRPFDNGLFELRTEPIRPELNLEERQDELFEYFRNMPQMRKARIPA